MKIKDFMAMFVGNTCYDDSIYCAIVTSENYSISSGREQPKGTLYYGDSLDMPQNFYEMPFEKWDMIGNVFIIITKKVIREATHK